MARQATGANWAAYALLPNRHPLPNDAIEQVVVTTIKSLAKDPDQGRICHLDLIDFRAKAGKFLPGTLGLDDGIPPRQFWTAYASSGRFNELAGVALRLFGCIANAVPSERAFSTMNFLKDDNSNRLTSSNLDMRLFVYINKKILLGMDDKSVKFEELYEVDESFYEQVQIASAENMNVD